MTARTAHPAPHPADLHHKVATGAFDPADVAVIFANHPGGFVLESVCDTASYGRFSIFGAAPINRVVADSRDRTAVIDALDRLRLTVPVNRPADIADLPFVAGWVGCVPYEAGAILENVSGPNATSRDHARLRFDLYDSAVVHDRATGKWHLCAVDLPESSSPAPDRIRLLHSCLQQSTGATEQYRGRRDGACESPHPDLTRDEYLARVARAQAYIAAGDIYQVNLTQRFTAATSLSPLAAYLRLRDANPADFAALIRDRDRAVISASPELFLQVSPDGAVVTRPIKGTRPRGGDPATDFAARTALRESVKDRAELHMIIDLLRNDLGRVCKFGSVRVLADADIETHPTVLHLVGTITGRLRPGIAASDLLAASLPGGSVTGCPKIRAMQIIRELEPVPRGAYCGAIGYLGIDGGLCMNVAIRTMTHVGDALHIHAGGAITSDSDPTAEYAETLAKAEGMFRALGHTTASLDAAVLVR